MLRMLLSALYLSTSVLVRGNFLFFQPVARALVLPIVDAFGRPIRRIIVPIPIILTVARRPRRHCMAVCVLLFSVRKRNRFSINIRSFPSSAHEAPIKRPSTRRRHKQTTKLPPTSALRTNPTLLQGSEPASSECSRRQLCYSIAWRTRVMCSSLTTRVILTKYHILEYQSLLKF